jgi:signal transduction histidine kinase
MARNALEASADGGVARVWCEAVEGGGDPTRPAVRFSVHNDGAIAPELQPRIFQRSFSTKAQRGRGLGTYSMKLLGERYLGGAVSFASSAERGTTFSIALAERSAAPVMLAGASC